MSIFHSAASFFKRFRTGVQQDPVRDWLILIILSAIALAGIIAWNVWNFDIAASGTAGTPAAAHVPSFNNASLDAIRTIFSNRAAEEAKYVTGTYRFTDPSQ